MQYMASFLPVLQQTTPRHAMVYVAAEDLKAESKTFGVQVDSASSTLNFYYSAIVPNAGVAGLGAYTVSYGLAVTPDVVHEEASWWDAAQIYQKWALASAAWTKQGPMSQRPELAPWMFNLTTWVNSHWQGLDIFNRTGGDPEVVANRVTAIADRFGLAKDALALHWCVALLVCRSYYSCKETLLTDVLV